MTSPLPAREIPADEEALRRLPRALEWEAAGHAPGWWPLSGALIQAIVLCPWLVSMQPNAAPNSRLALHAASVQVFAPQPSAAPGRLRLAPRICDFARGLRRDLPDAAAPALAVDLNAIKLEFADDVDEQLPEVVRQNGGMLALLDKDDQTMARYILQPPSWTAQEDIRDISRQFHLTMTPARRWAVFRRAAELSGVDLNSYSGCAIFDDTFRHCLKDAIRRRAMLEGPSPAGRVASARLAFAVGSPCGIRVLSVGLARPAGQ